MANEIKRQETTSVGLVSEERLWLAQDGKTIVHDGDWRAWQLIVAKGSIIPEKIAKRLKLEKARIEPLEMAPAKSATVAPEAIETRHTRPEKPTTER